MFFQENELVAVTRLVTGFPLYYTNDNKMFKCLLYLGNRIVTDIIEDGEPWPWCKFSKYCHQNHLQLPTIIYVGPFYPELLELKNVHIRKLHGDQTRKSSEN